MALRTDKAKTVPGAEEVAAIADFRHSANPILTKLSAIALAPPRFNKGFGVIWCPFREEGAASMPDSCKI